MLTELPVDEAVMGRRTRAMQRTDTLVRSIFFMCVLLVLAILGVFIFVGLNGSQAFLDKGGAKFPRFLLLTIGTPLGIMAIQPSVHAILSLVR